MLRCSSLCHLAFAEHFAEGFSLSMSSPCCCLRVELRIWQHDFRGFLALFPFPSFIFTFSSLSLSVAVLLSCDCGALSRKGGCATVLKSPGGRFLRSLCLLAVRLGEPPWGSTRVLGLACGVCRSAHWLLPMPTYTGPCGFSDLLRVLGFMNCLLLEFASTWPS